MRKPLLLSLIFFVLSVTTYAQSNVINLALNKPSEASTIYDSRFPASKAFDGDNTDNSRWSAAKNAATDQWLQVDLQEATLFDRILVTEYKNEKRISSFKVQVSDDTVLWTDVAVVNSSIPDGGIISFEPVTSRYVRLFIVLATREPTINEMGVYYQKTPLPDLGVTMKFEDMRGPLTDVELTYYKAYLKGLSPATNNIGNTLVYGRIGLAAEGMAFMYAATRDREILDILIRHCDYMLYCRNDQPGGDKRTIWTGIVEKCWPNKAMGELDQPYSGSENGDILGHIYFCAYLILLSPELHALEAPASDKLTDWGTTYLDRAKKFIAMCDEGMEFVEKLIAKDGRMYYPNTPAWRAMGTFYADRNGRGIPVNQQMMLLNGFQKAVECYEVLGINPEKKEEYMKVIQNSIDWQHETLETRRITVNGVSQEYCRWYYHMAGNTVEDYGHAAFTMQTYYKLLDSGLFTNLDTAKLIRFSNTFKYVMYDKATHTVSHKVDGTTPSSEKRPSAAKAGWVLLSIVDPELYDYLLTMPGNTATDPGLMAHFLYAKSKMFGVKGFTASPIDLSNYGKGTGIESVKTTSESIYVSGSVKDRLFIETGLPLKSVKVIGMDGQVLINQSFELEVSVAHLSSGIYLVRLEAMDGSVIIKKIIKQ